MITEGKPERLKVDILQGISFPQQCFGSSVCSQTARPLTLPAQESGDLLRHVMRQGAVITGKSLKGFKVNRKGVALHNPEGVEFGHFSIRSDS